MINFNKFGVKNFESNKANENQSNQIQDFSKIEIFEDIRNLMKYRADKKNGKKFADFISKCVNMKNIEKSFLNDLISDTGLEDIGRGLQQCSKIQILILNFRRNNLGSTQPHLEFAKAISASKDHLTQINLDFGVNQLQDESSKCFMKSISTCSQLQQLSLWFSNNKISELFSECFDGFENLTNLKSLKLDLSQNESIGFGVSKITEKISNINQLESLILNFQKTLLSCQVLKLASNNINKIANLKYLELNLQQNNLENTGVQQIQFPDLQSLETLKLFLGWTSINRDGLFNLGLNISNCKSLKKIELELKFNMIEQNLIIHQNEINKQLVCLDNLTLHLRQNNLSCEGLSKIIEYFTSVFKINSLEINAEANQLKSNLSFLGSTLSKAQIQSLNINLEENEIENEGIVQLFNQFSQNTKLEKLSINLLENKINYECYEELGLKLSSFQSLYYLYIKINKFHYLQAYDETQLLLKQISRSKSINQLIYLLPGFVYRDRPLLKILKDQCKKAKYFVKFRFLLF